MVCRYRAPDRTKGSIRYLDRIRARLKVTHEGIQSLERFDPERKIKTEKDLRDSFTEKELQGMVMIFHYLHPHEVEASSIPLSLKKGFLLLNSFRRIIKLHMNPSEYLYLFNPFDEVSSSYEMGASLGKERLRGCMMSFNYLAPEESSPSQSLSLPLSSSSSSSSSSPHSLSPSSPLSPSSSSLSASLFNSSEQPSSERNRSLAVILSLVSSLQSLPTEMRLMFPGESENSNSDENSSDNRPRLRVFISTLPE